MINKLLSFGGRFVLILLIGIGSMVLCKGQNAYNARFQLATLDTTEAVACYDLQIANAGAEPWTLASFNIALFYDARAACYSGDSLIPPGFIYRADNVNNSIVGGGLVMNSGLTYEDSLGFIRLGLTFVEEGIGELLPADGSWFSTIRVCFDIKLSDITAPNTCLQVNFSDDQSRSALNVFPDIVQFWNSDNSASDATENMKIDVLPNANYNSCFVLTEDSEDLCSDGIDNDEDGLLDCLDDECNPGNLLIESLDIECINPTGRISILGGRGNINFSIDGGVSFSPDSIFDNLTAGIYDVYVTNNNVAGCAFTDQIIFEEPDCSETDESSCMDGLDNDGDGLIDCADDSCIPRIDEVILTSPKICPLLTDGIIEIISPFPNVEYSLDSGATYVPDPFFDSLPTGEYFLFIRNMITACAQPFVENPIMLLPAVTCIIPDEICNDGIDNDSDGLVDCTDADCAGLSNCINVPDFYLPNIIDINSSANNTLLVQSAIPIDLHSFAVYNRWGNLIYIKENISSADSGHGWKGEFNNNLVKSGVYIYHVQFDIDGQIIHHTGNVTVIN